MRITERNLRSFIREALLKESSDEQLDVAPGDRYKGLSAGSPAGLSLDLDPSDELPSGHWAQYVNLLNPFSWWHAYKDVPGVKTETDATLSAIDSFSSNAVPILLGSGFAIAPLFPPAAAVLVAGAGIVGGANSMLQGIYAVVNEKPIEASSRFALFALDVVGGAYAEEITKLIASRALRYGATKQAALRARVAARNLGLGPGQNLPTTPAQARMIRAAMASPASTGAMYASTVGGAVAGTAAYATGKSFDYLAGEAAEVDDARELEARLGQSLPEEDEVLMGEILNAMGKDMIRLADEIDAQRAARKLAANQSPTKGIREIAERLKDPARMTDQDVDYVVKVVTGNEPSIDEDDFRELIELERTGQSLAY
jgi:hypothetical protein